MLRRTCNLLLGKPCPNQFLSTLTGTGLTAYFGVPDSLLKELCRCITWHGENKGKESDLGIEHHVIAANEGNAIGLATGYYLSTSKIPVVYMQNSGLGNCINPLTSICHSEVYSIPMILLIGWRGRPGSKPDEPQHTAMGRLTTNILDSCEIPYTLLNTEEGSMDASLKKAMEHCLKHRTPYAILVDRDTFGPVPDSIKAGEVSGKANPAIKLGREEAIESILGLLPNYTPVVSTTGMISREVYETRQRLNQSNSSDFLTVGAMGHASSIAMGVVLGQQSQAVALTSSDKEAATGAKANVEEGIKEGEDQAAAVAAAEKAEHKTPATPIPEVVKEEEKMKSEGGPIASQQDHTAADKKAQEEVKEKIVKAAGENHNRKVVCLDGDGAFLMHLGAAAITGTGLTPNNFIHIVLNNGAHDSVGGQPTVAFDCDLTTIAKSCGYTVLPPVMDADDLDQSISEVVSFIEGTMKCDRPMFLEIQCKKGSRADLGRPKSSAYENCTNFMKFVQKNKALQEPVIPGCEPYVPSAAAAAEETASTSTKKKSSKSAEGKSSKKKKSDK